MCCQVRPCESGYCCTEKGQFCGCDDDDCCWKCLKKWEIDPEQACCCKQREDGACCGCALWWWILPLIVMAFLLLGFGCSQYIKDNKMPEYFIEVDQIPVWNSTSFSKVQITTNCSISLSNTTSLLEDCSTMSQNMTVLPTSQCAVTNCQTYQKTCSPCYFNCYTDDCWVAQQQEDCLTETKPFDCSVTYGDVRTIYSCKKNPNSSMPICQKDCADFMCQAPTDYTCDCVNGDCMLYQNKICYVERVYYVTLTLYSQYTVKEEDFIANLITKVCLADDLVCQSQFIGQYNSTDLYYNMYDPSTYITEWDVSHSPGTLGMVSMGVIIMFLGLCFFVCYCCDVCTRCRTPIPVPKPYKAPKPVAPKPAPVPKVVQPIQLSPSKLPPPYASSSKLISPSEVSRSVEHHGIKLIVDKDAKCIICGNLLADNSLIVMACRHIYHDKCVLGKTCIHPECNPSTPVTLPAVSNSPAVSVSALPIDIGPITWHEEESHHKLPIII